MRIRLRLSEILGCDQDGGEAQHAWQAPPQPIAEVEGRDSCVKRAFSCLPSMTMCFFCTIIYNRTRATVADHK